MKANKQEEIEEEMDDIEYVDEILQEDVVPNIVTRIRDTTGRSAVVSVFSLIIALAMCVIGIISIIKIGWLIGLFMILFGILVALLIALISQIIDLSLNNHMFLTVMYEDFRGFFDIKKIQEMLWRLI